MAVATGAHMIPLWTPDSEHGMRIMFAHLGLDLALELFLAMLHPSL